MKYQRVRIVLAFVWLALGLGALILDDTFLLAISVMNIGVITFSIVTERP